MQCVCVCVCVCIFVCSLAHSTSHITEVTPLNPTSMKAKGTEKKLYLCFVLLPKLQSCKHKCYSRHKALFTYIFAREKTLRGDVVCVCVFVWEGGERTCRHGFIGDHDSSSSCCERKSLEYISCKQYRCEPDNGGELINS